MQALTIEIKNANALKTLQSLEEKRFIRIVDDSDFDSPSLPGLPLSLKAFKKWVLNSEDMPGGELKEAKTKWANKKKLLQKYIK